MSSFVENDGGRAAAGFKGHTGDNPYTYRMRTIRPGGAKT